MAAPKRAGRDRSETRKPSVFWFLAFMILPFVNLITRFKFRNPERMPETGAFVLSPNHYSEIDPLIVGAAAWKLGRAPRFMAKASLFKLPVAGWALRASGQIPVERSGSKSHTALKAAEELVRNGRMVIVYPEGSLTRDPDLWPMRGKTGAVRIALERGIPIVPVAHWGTQKIMPRYGKKISMFPRTTVEFAFGEPLDLSKYQGKLDQATLTAATDELMNRIAGLLAELRGEPAPAQRWEPSAHGQSETGRFEP